MDINLGKQQPDVYKAMVELDARAAEAAEKAGLPPLLRELVKIRVSQINGCAFCLRMHVRDATALGETADRLAVVAAWWESQYFSAQEQAALRIAEQVTGLARGAAVGDTEVVLTPEQAAAITWQAIVMNSWNRIAIASHYPVAP